MLYKLGDVEGKDGSERSIIRGYISWLNVEVEKREEKKENKRGVNLSSASTQEPRRFIKDTSRILH